MDCMNVNLPGANPEPLGQPPTREAAMRKLRCLLADLGSDEYLEYTREAERAADELDTVKGALAGLFAIVAPQVADVARGVVGRDDRVTRITRIADGIEQRLRALEEGRRALQGQADGLVERLRKVDKKFAELAKAIRGNEDALYANRMTLDRLSLRIDEVHAHIKPVRRASKPKRRRAK